MKIIIPMSGVGQRFIDGGYKTPKPVIEVDGKPIISHLVSLFSPKDEFVFICNEDHLKLDGFSKILENLPVEKTIVSTKKSLGPVWAVLQAQNKIENDEPVIINYCDFAFDWNYDSFKKTMVESGCDAGVTAYTGFHPHLLGPGLYASMRVKDNWMLECREKHSFTEDKMDTFHQTGTFYFSMGRLVRDFFKRAVDGNVMVNGEFYVSSVTQMMVEAGLSVYVYPVEHFLQWGTPQDLAQYNAWSGFFAKLERGEESEWPEPDRRTYNYWKFFFAKCTWHPYGKSLA